MERSMSITRSRVISIALRGIGGVGLVVVFLASMVIAGRLRYYAGYFGTMVMACGFLAAWVATPESRAMAAKVIASLRNIGWSMKEAAIRADIDEAQLSRQLSGIEQMSLARYAAWGPDWEFSFGKALVEERGAMVVTQKELAGILRELQQSSGAQGRLKGAA